MVEPAPVELKFTLNEEGLARLRRSGRLKAMSVGAAKTRRLHATYHDTADERLLAEGITWRILREGRAYVQTVSLPPHNGGGPRIATSPLTGAVPEPQAVLDPQIAGALQDVLKEREIRPRISSDVRRTQRRLATANSDIIDVTLDNVALEAGEQHAKFCEARFELKAGKAESLVNLVRPLVEALELEPAFSSEAERGFALVHNERAHKAPWLVLPRDVSARGALQQIVRACLKHIADHAQVARLFEHSEAIHQIRVALRRLRSALSAYSRAFALQSLAALAKRARTLAARLGKARDLEVFASDIMDPARPAVTDAAALERLIATSDARRRAAWIEAREALNGAEFRLLMVDVAAVALEGASDNPHDIRPIDAMPARSFAEEVLERRLAKVHELGDRFSQLTIEERHELRKELKKLRYPSEFFASLFEGKGAKKYFAALSDLQDDLGRLNDVATARLLIEGLVRETAGSEPPETVARLALVAGEIIGWHAHRADKSRKRLAKHWDRFKDTTPFWRKG